MGPGRFIGSSIFYGPDGNDTLKGDRGNDWLYGGGLGDDVYLVGSSGDGVNEESGEGTDTVESSISYRLSENLENVTLNRDWRPPSGYGKQW